MSLNLKMILVKGSEFKMGRKHSKFPPDMPIHSVKLDSYFIGKYLVTQKLWVEIMNSNPSEFKASDNHPVENVTWDEVQIFIGKLNSKLGRNYRLPTEAEWEYAARGGIAHRFYMFSGSNDLDEAAWWIGNSNVTTQPVGQKIPNDLGIHDMTGNVWEWCNDWYDSNYYSNSPEMNPQGPPNGENKVRRGGAFCSFPDLLHIAKRSYSKPDGKFRYLGFRLAHDYI